MASMCAKLAFMVCVAMHFMHAVHACGEQLLYTGFDNHQEGFHSWNRGMAEADFPVGLKYTKGIARAEVGEGALRIKHPQGGVGPGGTGMLMRVNFPRDVESATLSYKVKFDPDYDWTAGGKLPGMCAADCPTGCKDMNTYPGWSSRIMFRKGGRCESYMYYPHMKDFGTCGKSWLTSSSFKSDTWQTVTLYVQLNTGGQPNGEQKVWLDGEQVLHQTGIKYRHGDGDKIHQLKFENFHGGKSDLFKPKKTQHIQFDYLKVMEGYCDPNGGDGGGIFTEEEPRTEPEVPVTPDLYTEETNGDGDGDGAAETEDAGEYSGGDSGGEMMDGNSGEYSGEHSGEYSGEHSGEYSGEHSGEDMMYGNSGEDSGEDSGVDSEEDSGGGMMGEHSAEHDGMGDGQHDGASEEDGGAVAEVYATSTDEFLSNFLGRKGITVGGTPSDQEDMPPVGEDGLPYLPNNDEEMDDDDNDSTDHDCGDAGEEVCTYEQVLEYGRKWECNDGYQNNGSGTCVPYTPKAY